MTALLRSEMVPGALAAGHSTRADVAVEPRFKVGQRVRAKNQPTWGTRALSATSKERSAS
jgi:hypothetical protein